MTQAKRKKEILIKKKYKLKTKNKYRLQFKKMKDARISLTVKAVLLKLWMNKNAWWIIVSTIFLHSVIVFGHFHLPYLVSFGQNDMDDRSFLTRMVREQKRHDTH